MEKQVPKITVTTRDAAELFLYDVAETVEKSYPIWEHRLANFLDDTPLSLEDKRGILEAHPLRYYYYAAIVAMEAAKIRTLYQDDIAEDILADINESIDTVADRSDRLVSDLVFDIMQRVRIADSDDTKKSHDIVMKRISELLHLHTLEDTKELFNDIVFRQDMAQPIAASMRHWWKGFKRCRQLAQTVSSQTPQPVARVESVRIYKIASTL
ncbi:MAG: hypothetical protein RIC29_14970 [Rhodospirillaceae bacterium]